MQDDIQDILDDLEVGSETDDSTDNSDEIDDILSDLSTDDDDSSDEDNETQNESQNVQQQKKPSRWKRKQQYLTQAKLDAEKAAEEARREATALRARVEQQEKMWAQLMSPIDAQQQQQASPAQQPANNLSADEIEERLLKKLSERAEKSREFDRIGSKWQPQLQRMQKQLAKDPQKSKQFSDWFGKYTGDLGSNPDKKLLLEVAGNLEYAAEALYTVNKSAQFANLSTADKIGALHKLHTDIVAKRNKQTASDKGIALPRGNNSSTGKKKTIGEMTAEEVWALRKQKANARRG
jgi:hypothetical protein